MKERCSELRMNEKFSSVGGGGKEVLSFVILVLEFSVWVYQIDRLFNPSAEILGNIYI